MKSNFNNLYCEIFQMRDLVNIHKCRSCNVVALQGDYLCVYNVALNGLLMQQNPSTARAHPILIS